MTEPTPPLPSPDLPGASVDCGRDGNPDTGPGGKPSESRRPLAMVLALVMLTLALFIRFQEDGRTGRLVLPWILERMVTWLTIVGPGLWVGVSALGLGVVAARILRWKGSEALASGDIGNSDRRLGTGDTLLICFGAGLALLPILFTVGFSGFVRADLAIAGICGLCTLGGAICLPGVLGTGLKGVGTDSIVQGKGSGWAQFGVRLGWVVAVLFLGLAALSPPLVFDVTEYHLGIFADFAAAGSATALPHNFYGRFPWPVQSLYYGSLWLGGGWHWSPDSWSDAGPKVLNSLQILGAGCVAWLWTRRALGSGQGSSWAPGLAAVMTLSHPVLMEVSLDAYIDGPIAFLAALSVYGLWLSTRPGVRSSILPMVGLCVGATLSAKYTVLQHWAVPAFLLFGLPALSHAWRQGAESRRHGMVALGLALGPVLFWLIRNAVIYGNPVEPFAQRIFSGDARAIQLERYYLESHFPQAPWSLEYWQSLPRRVAGLDGVALACGFLPVLAWWAGDRSGRLANLRSWSRDQAFPWLRVALLAGLMYLSWNTVRESQQRFLLPLVPVMAAAAATGLVYPGVPRLLRWVGALSLALLAINSFWFQMLRLSHASVGEFALSRDWNNRPEQRARLIQYYRSNLGRIGDIAGRVASELPRDSRLLLVHEARPYLFPLGAVYCTIWDEDPLLMMAKSLMQELGRAPTTEELRSKLSSVGLTHILVNRVELLRYIRQYARPSQYTRAGINPRTVTGDPALLLLQSSPIPEDHYPPYLNSPDWPQLRGPIQGLLRELRSEATLTTGVAPLEIWVAPLRGTKPARNP